MRGPGAGALLGRAMIASAAAAGAPVTIDDARSIGWASATFSGERHVIELSAANARRLDEWLSGLAEIDLPVRGHVVADLAVTERRSAAGLTRVRLEALTVAGG